MPFEYQKLDQARSAKGLRMVVVSGVPSPWGEAAKGILHVKGIPWTAIRLNPTSKEMADWTLSRSGPVAIYDDELPRSGWAEILLLAERLAPKPSLLSANTMQRSRILGLSHEICGEDGLSWARRLQGVHASLNDEPGFPPSVAQYLGEKYGYRPEIGPSYRQRVTDLLSTLSSLLHEQAKIGSPFYFGDVLSAVDIYSATAMALFKPLPPELCDMPEAFRLAFSTLDDVTAEALDPILLKHRDFVYADFLETPLNL